MKTFFPSYLLDDVNLSLIQNLKYLKNSRSYIQLSHTPTHTHTHNNSIPVINLIRSLTVVNYLLIHSFSLYISIYPSTTTHNSDKHHHHHHRLSQLKQLPLHDDYYYFYVYFLKIIYDKLISISSFVYVGRFTRKFLFEKK